MADTMDEVTIDDSSQLSKPITPVLIDDLVPFAANPETLPSLNSGMTLPLPAIEAKFINLNEVLKRLQNFQVDTFFASDKTDSPELAEQRTYFKDALTIDLETDNLLTAYIKFDVFNTFKGLDESEVYTIPLSTVANIGMRGQPQLHLYFVEVNYLADSGRRIADGQIAGIRLVDKTSGSLTIAGLTSLGEKCRDLFNGYLWDKGKNMVSYSDPDKGYNLQILCQTKEGGVETLGKVLAIRDHEVIGKYVNFKENSEPDQAYPDIFSEVEILGKKYKTERRRPDASVKLRAALLFIDGLQKPKVLYDSSGKYREALVRNE